MSEMTTTTQEALDWPPTEALDWAATVFATIWFFTQGAVFFSNLSGYHPQKSILIGIEFCEVFAILLSWIGMGQEAFVSYTFLWLGILSVLLAVSGLFLTWLRDFENKDPKVAKAYKSLMMWTTTAEYFPLLIVSFLINNWTLTAYNAIMMIQTPISVSEVINSIELGFRDGLFTRDSVSCIDLEYGDEPMSPLMEEAFDDGEEDSEEEYPYRFFCFRFNLNMVAIFVFGTLVLIGFVTAIIVGAENQLALHWECEHDYSVEKCENDYFGLDDKFNSYSSVCAFAIMLLPTLIFVACYYFAEKGGSANPKYALAVIQMCEISGMLTSWFQFGEQAWDVVSVFCGVLSVFSAVLGTWCLMCTITYSSELGARDTGKEIEYELRYYCPCQCCCCKKFYTKTDFEKHMAISTIAEFIFFGINASYNHGLGWAAIMYAFVMVRQIYMTERFLLKISAMRDEIVNYNLERVFPIVDTDEECYDDEIYL